MNKLWINKINIALFFLLFAILLVPIFLQLDYRCLDSWDEALFAIRAYYIAEHGVPIKVFSQLEGLTSLNNSKPAFMSYIQAFFMKIFGYNELALRLPTSLSLLAICALFIYYSKKIFSSYYVGAIASVIFICTPAVLDIHMGRSADQDIPFSLLCFLLIIHSYHYIEQHSLKHLSWAFLFFLLAFFTKSVAVFLCFPALVLYALYNKQLFPLLKQKALWTIIIATGIGLALLYFSGARHLNNIRRLSSVVQHEGSFDFYFDYLVCKAQFYWVFLIFFIYACFLFRKNTFNALLVLETLSILLILSFAKTKLHWYAAPIYPLMSFASAYAVYQSLNWLYEKSVLQNRLKKALLAALIFVLFVPVYLRAIQLIYLQPEPRYANEVCQILKRIKNTHPEIKNIKLINADEGIYAPNIEFYTLLYEDKFAYEIQADSNVRHTQNGDYLIIFEKQDIRQLQRSYEIRTLYKFQSTFLFEAFKAKTPYIR